MVHVFEPQKSVAMYAVPAWTPSPPAITGKVQIRFTSPCPRPVESERLSRLLNRVTNVKILRQSVIVILCLHGQDRLQQQSHFPRKPPESWHLTLSPNLWPTRLCRLLCKCQRTPSRYFLFRRGM